QRTVDGALREDIDVEGDLRVEPLEPLSARVETPVVQVVGARTTFVYAGDPFEGSGRDASAL
ncbi:MAG TPA: hypothetical protein VFS93_02790, partial [Terrimesophilobacter sp.]|nr:hypothetical protein [Terrimesophilobacter sp.]